MSHNFLVYWRTEAAVTLRHCRIQNTFQVEMPINHHWKSTTKRSSLEEDTMDWLQRLISLDQVRKTQPSHNDIKSFCRILRVMYSIDTGWENHLCRSDLTDRWSTVFRALHYFYQWAANDMFLKILKRNWVWWKTWFEFTFGILFFCIHVNLKWTKQESVILSSRTSDSPHDIKVSAACILLLVVSLMSLK